VESFNKQLSDDYPTFLIGIDSIICFEFDFLLYIFFFKSMIFCD
jgi:hypothetical protein